MPSPLEYADMKTEGKEDIFGLFRHMGEEYVERKIEESSNSSGFGVELKTTSVRLRPQHLEALDAIVSRFGLTRNEAFGYAITQFMADAISGYSFGIVDGIGNFENYEQAVSDERKKLVAGLELDDEGKKFISNLTKYDFLKRLGAE